MIFVPVYEGGDLPDTVRARRERIDGFAYAPIRTDLFFHSAFRSLPSGLRVSMITTIDGERREIYASAPRLEQSLRYESPLPIAGRRWTFVAEVPFPSISSLSSILLPVLLSGTVASGALFFATRTLVEARREAERFSEELLRRESLLRESEQRFRMLADRAPVIFWLADTEGKLLWANRGWLAFSGQTLAQALATGFVPFVHPDERDALREQCRSSIAKRSSISVKLRARNAEGEYRWLIAVSQPVFVANDLVQFVGTATDVTEMERAREVLHQEGERLEREVQRRTEELERSTERLRISERMAALGRLSAGLGHDMGNLLLPVRVRLDSLEAHELEDEVRNDVHAIRDAVEYLQRLTSGLRMLAVDPTQSAPGAHTNLTEWWQDIRPLLRNTLPRHVTLQAEVPENLPALRISRHTLSQIVFNIVQNAGELLSREPHGCVSLQATLAAPNRVELRIANDGPSMSPETMQRCFEPFYTTKARSLSTGLGLALVHSLVQRAEGTIQVVSNEPRGVVFVIALHAAPQRSEAHVPVALRVENPRLEGFVRSVLRTLPLDETSDLDTAALLVVDESYSSQAMRFVSKNHGRRALLLGATREALPAAVAQVVQPFHASALRMQLERTLKEYQAHRTPTTEHHAP